jgi:hypothetical protein
MSLFETTCRLEINHSCLHESGDNDLDLLRVLLSDLAVQKYLSMYV